MAYCGWTWPPCRFLTPTSYCVCGLLRAATQSDLNFRCWLTPGGLSADLVTIYHQDARTDEWSVVAASSWVKHVDGNGKAYCSQPQSLAPASFHHPTSQTTPYTHA
ncbi:hypothetical protein Pelo_19595 [Pelomyxa schiedti]|nr:hypothetical protein Pelo_19595 [Pelomyxa schiedti]